MQTAPSKTLTLSILLIGVLAVSTGAILVRLADAHPLVVAAYRMGIAFLVILPFTGISAFHTWRSLPRALLYRTLAAGCFLALHFACWISSLSYTSVASSVVLVNTIPIWVGLLTPVLTRDRVGRLLWASIFLTVVGSFLLTRTMTSPIGEHQNLGNLLALAGGLSAALYLLLGRSVREKVSTADYITLCYGCAAALLWIVVLGFRWPVSGFNTGTWVALAALALVSQHLGHSSYNWVLKHLPAGMVAVTLLGEPLFSSLLAFGLFNEKLGPLQGLGALVILLGIYLAARRPPPALSVSDS